MKIYCPQCGVKGSADDSYSGRKVRCPKCLGMFDLQPDMAINQVEFLTADLEAENRTETREQQAVQQDAVTAASSLEDAVADHPEITKDPDDSLLDLPEEVAEESVVAEQEVTEEDSPMADDSLDWGNFGSEPDKEIAESEQEEIESPVDIDEPQGEEDPVANFAAEIDAVIDEPEKYAEGTLADDLGDVVEIQDEEETLPEESLELASELVEEPESSEDDVAEAIAEFADTSIDEVEITLDDNSNDEPEGDGNNLATLTAVAAAVPLFAGGGETSDEDKKDSTDTIEDEVVSFADEDLPDTNMEDVPDIVIGGDDEVVVEDEPYGIDKEQCWQCGKKDSVGEPFVAIDGRLYCTDCSPAEESDETGDVDFADAPGVDADAADVTDEGGVIEEETAALCPAFTVGGVIKEAWNKVKGIKGAVWAGSAVMYLILIVIAAGGSKLWPSTEIEAATLGSYIPSVLLLFVLQVLYMIFMGGLLFMGIRRVAGNRVSWKMIFHGFSFTGKIVGVTILQSLLITIGFLLLILPGIYLMVGYAMAIPLIVDKNLSPWQALETSRAAVHKVWWRVAAIGLLTCLLFIVASIPLGLGLIWVWPLAFVVSGVVYHRLFYK